MELVKLLAGPAAGRALAIAARTGILAQVLPELEDTDAAIARAEAAPAEPGLRMAALLREVPARAVDGALRRLTYSNADRARIVGLVGEAAALRADPPDDVRLRRALGRVGRSAAADLAVLVDDPRAARRLGEIGAAGDPLAAADLALTGADVMRILDARPGPAIGQAIARLLDRVLADPSQNTRERLEQLLREDAGAP